jgi:hypothetical protein
VFEQIVASAMIAPSFCERDACRDWSNVFVRTMTGCADHSQKSGFFCGRTQIASVDVSTMQGLQTRELS